jgi:hypothetical protein
MSAHRTVTGSSRPGPREERVVMALVAVAVMRWRRLHTAGRVHQSSVLLWLRFFVHGCPELLTRVDKGRAELGT